MITLNKIKVICFLQFLVIRHKYQQHDFLKSLSLYYTLWYNIGEVGDVMKLITWFQKGQRFTFDDLLEQTQLDPITLSTELDRLVTEKLLQKKEAFYALKPTYAIGLLDIKNQGFGFLLQPEDDLYIYEEDMGYALDGDLVLVRVGVRNKVVEVIEHNTSELVVHVKKINTQVWFLPIKPLRLKIEIETTQPFLGGEVLLVNLDRYEGKSVFGSIIKTLGFETDPGMDILELVYQANWPYEFSPEALHEAEHIESIDTAPRREVQDELIVTIDGTDAKDLDDAVALKVNAGQYILSVHIADVSAYVRPNSYLDRDAIERTTSVYLADRVIPMLPRKLSNDLCSLNAGTRKKCLSVTMVLDEHANVIDHKIEQTWITVDKRLNYDEVNMFLDGETRLYTTEIEQMILDMAKLSQQLEEKRRHRGALEFKSLEFKYETDDLGNIIDIHPYVTGKGQKLIESFMVLANETVSMHLSSMELPCIYRVHDKPTEEKLMNVMNMVKEMGIKIPKLNHITPKTLQNIIDKLEGHPLEIVFHTMFLRAMQKAEYSQKNIGHYGLASQFYSHFTSPIRRYPDLLLHRLIRVFLIDTQDFDHNFRYYDSMIETIAEKCSMMERKADELARETDKLKTTQFMANKKNQTFEAVISNITKAGIFVRLDNGIEGLAPVRLMKDYYYFDDVHLTLKGKNNRQEFSIGKAIKVKLIDCDIVLRQLTFTVFEEKNNERKEFNRNPKQKGKA